MRYSLANFKPVSACPRIIVETIERLMGESEAMESSQVIQAMARLSCDLNMVPVWETIRSSGIEEIAQLEAAMIFSFPWTKQRRSTSFDSKTNAERRKWHRSTRSAAERLLKLLDDGPELTTGNVIEAINLDGMKWFLRLIDVNIVPDDSENLGHDNAKGKWNVREWSLLRAQRGSLPLSLRDLLLAVIDELDEGVVSTQTIKKPGDARVDRAQYILRITESVAGAPYRLTDEQVATVVRVVIEDPSVTASLVNRFRWRKEKADLIGRRMQDSDTRSENLE